MFDRRALKARARGALHGAMSVPALYYPLDRDVDTVGIPCSVRVHRKQSNFGDMTGFDYDPAERIEIVPEIVCLKAEVSPSRGGVFSLAADEAYQVETVFPPDGITVTAQVSRRSQAQIDSDVITCPGAV